MNKFQALVVHGADAGGRAVIEWRPTEALPDNEVRIQVEYSSLNYKDALALNPGSKVVRNYPRVPGIDLAGLVIESNASDVAVGTRVLAHGYGIGTDIDGGFQEQVCVPAEWVVPLRQLSTRDAMAVGTAGFTAAMSVFRIRAHGITPSDGPVLVTGANGGVGGVAVNILASLGYEVVASTGTAAATERLKRLGASDVIARFAPNGSSRPLSSARWAAAVDSTGGSSLAALLSEVQYGGFVAASGLTAGSDLPTTVMPFILRGVTLAGIDSVQLPMPIRREIWKEIEGDLLPPSLNLITEEIALMDVLATLTDLVEQRHSGRTIVQIGQRSPELTD